MILMRYSGCSDKNDDTEYQKISRQHNETFDGGACQRYSNSVNL